VDPYRDPHEKPQEPPRARRTDLGPARKTHKAVRPRWFMVAAVVLSVVCAAAAAPRDTDWAPAVVLTMVIAAFVGSLAWRPARTGPFHVVLHEEGVAVHEDGSTRQIAFEDVDELWWTIERRWTLFQGSVAFAMELRLVDHEGASYVMPTRVEDADALILAVERRCSKPLEAPARAALRGGEPLRFGPLTMDETGLRGKDWDAPWESLREVRFSSGRVQLYRRQGVVAWRTIALDQVPHPSVFLKLMQDFAARVAKANGR
jgi:hypothetical protein